MVCDDFPFWALRLYANAPTHHTDPTAEEQAQLDSRTLVNPIAKVAHRLYEFCEPFLVQSDSGSPPEEVQGFDAALKYAIAWVASVAQSVMGGTGVQPTPTGWRLRFSELCRRLRTKSGVCVVSECLALIRELALYFPA